jgi:hypothetical protein
MKFPACSTDTPRSRRATRSLPTLRRASPYRDGANNQGKEVCSFRILACRWLSRSNRVPYRSVDYNRAQDTKTSSKSPQESVSDVAFPERGSFEDRGKGTTERCRAASATSLRRVSLLAPQAKFASESSDFARSRERRGHGRMLGRPIESTPFFGQQRKDYFNRLCFEPFAFEMV